MNRTREESLADLAGIVALAGEAPDLRVRASLATAFGCPFAPGASGNIATEDLVFQAGLPEARGPMVG